MAAIPISSIAAPGVVSTPAALGVAATATTGDTIASPDDRTIVVVFNGSGGSINVTISDPGSTPAGNTPTLATRAVAAGALGFFPVSPANADPVTGAATVICSAVTSVRVAAVRR